MRDSTDLAGYRQGCLRFLADFHETLGVECLEGQPGFCRDDQGHAIKLEGSARAREVSLRALAEAICGHDAVNRYFDPSQGAPLGNRALLEAAIDPTSFININTFNLAVSGLVNAEIIERFNAPEYLGRNLVTIKPTKMNGQKMIGVTRISPQTAAAKGRMPGQPHAEVGFSDQYKTTPETVEQALKIKVTKEAPFYDLTGEVLDQAGQVGDELGYGQEKAIADMVLGVTASYNLNGTAYNTYQTSSPYINDHSNPFSDQLDVDEARQLFVGMTDPHTGREIVVNSYDILCMPARELKIRESLFGTNVQIGTQLSSNFPGRWTQSANVINQVGRGTFTLTPLTAIWYNRATSADGLNLSASNAKEYWYVGDYKKAFFWMENWPLTPWQASADELTMWDQGLIAVYGANYRGVGFVSEPRYVVRNKN